MLLTCHQGNEGTRAMCHWEPGNTTWIQYQTRASFSRRTKISQHTIGGASKYGSASLDEPDVCNVVSQNRPLLLPHPCKRVVWVNNPRTPHCQNSPLTHSHTFTPIWGYATAIRSFIYAKHVGRSPGLNSPLASNILAQAHSPVGFANFPFSPPTRDSGREAVHTSLVHRLISPISPSDTTPESFSIQATDITFWT